MPVTGSASVANSNVVTQVPSLPVPMQYGTVSWGVSFEGQPTGSLEYTGVTETSLSSLRSAYKIDNTVTIYGIKLRVTSFNYSRDGYIYKGNIKFSVYKFSIELGGRYEEKLEREIKLKPLANAAGEVSIHQIASAAGVPYTGAGFNLKVDLAETGEITSSLSAAISSRIRLLGRYASYNSGVKLSSMGSGGSWSFPDTDIITDGPNSIGKTGAYNDAVLTGGFINPPPPNNTGTPANNPTFTYLGPNIQTITEEDDNPTQPPPYSLTLQELSSCFDHSGPKKVRKITTQVYGQPDTEEIWTYGFVYTARQIATLTSGTPDVPLLSTNPAIYWRVIEYQKLQYIYTAPPQLTLQIYATDPKDPSKKYAVALKQGYGQFASVSPFGGNVTFSSTASYLTAIVTSGWKVCRYKKEEEPGYQTLSYNGTQNTTVPTGSSLGFNGILPNLADPEYLDWLSYQFFILPTLAKTAYLLKPSRAVYGGDVGSPFSVEWVNYNELTVAEKQGIDQYTQVNGMGQVAMLTPDINYVEPMIVEIETTSKSGYSYAQDPADPLQIVKTGEETYSQARRTVTDANKYKEQSTEYSSQDPGFSTSLEQIKFKEVLGKLPDASHRSATAQQNPVTPLLPAPPVTIQKYTVSSDNASSVESGGSLDYPDATTLTMAKKAIATELEIEEINASSEQKTVTWFYPTIRDGDRVVTGMDKFAGLGSWIVKSASWTLNYHGKKASFGSGILVTTDGTQLTLGLLRNRSVSHTVQTIALPPSPTEGQGQITTGFAGGNFTLGSVFSNQPNRRNF